MSHEEPASKPDRAETERRLRAMALAKGDPNSDTDFVSIPQDWMGVARIHDKSKNRKEFQGMLLDPVREYDRKSKTHVSLTMLAFWLSVIAAAVTIVGLLLSLTGMASSPWFLPLTISALTALGAIPMVCSFWNGRLKAIVQARSRSSIAKFSVRELTNLAALIAGQQKGPILRDEWRAHLAGESRNDPVSWRKVQEAAGFVVAGIRDRGQDWTEAAWRPADIALRSRFLSGLVVVIPTGLVAWDVLRHEGTLGVFTSFGSIFAVGTALAGMIRAGRKRRDIDLPEPKVPRG